MDLINLRILFGFGRYGARSRMRSNSSLFKLSKIHPVFTGCVQRAARSRTLTIRLELSTFSNLRDNFMFYTMGSRSPWPPPSNRYFPFLCVQPTLHNMPFNFDLH